MDTLQLTILLEPRDPWAEILVAQLSELGFDAFEETEHGVIAYGPKDKIDLEKVYDESLISEQHDQVSIQVEQSSIPFQNWNETWEADFQPVFVEDRLSILAPFHDKQLAKEISIEIQPQMSFGTGHHQTTWLMSKALLDLEEMPDSVLDMGTGTGVLAILAEKLGAAEILAIDIEDWSVQNTIENAERNHCVRIDSRHGDVDLIRGKQFGMILANINKNVLKKHMPDYSAASKPGALLYLSGFFATDSEELIAFTKNYAYKHLQTVTKEGWAMLSFTKC